MYIEQTRKREDTKTKERKFEKKDNKIGQYAEKS